MCRNTDGKWVELGHLCVCMRVYFILFFSQHNAQGRDLQKRKTQGTDSDPLNTATLTFAELQRDKKRETGNSHRGSRDAPLVTGEEVRHVCDVRGGSRR